MNAHKFGFSDGSKGHKFGSDEQQTVINRLREIAEQEERIVSMITAMNRRIHKNEKMIQNITIKNDNEIHRT